MWTFALAFQIHFKRTSATRLSLPIQPNTDGRSQKLNPRGIKMPVNSWSLTCFGDGTFVTQATAYSLHVSGSRKVRFYQIWRSHTWYILRKHCLLFQTGFKRKATKAIARLAFVTFLLTWSELAVCVQLSLWVSPIWKWPHFSQSANNCTVRSWTAGSSVTFEQLCSRSWTDLLLLSFW